MPTSDTDAVLAKLPPDLHRDYREAWDAYDSVCRRRASDLERAAAWEVARRVQERWNAAVVVAGAELQRQEKRTRAKAVRG